MSLGASRPRPPRHAAPTDQAELSRRGVDHSRQHAGGQGDRAVQRQLNELCAADDLVTRERAIATTHKVPGGGWIQLATSAGLAGLRLITTLRGPRETHGMALARTRPRASPAALSGGPTIKKAGVPAGIYSPTRSAPLRCRRTRGIGTSSLNRLQDRAIAAGNRWTERRDRRKGQVSHPVVHKIL